MNRMIGADMPSLGAPMGSDMIGVFGGLPPGIGNGNWPQLPQGFGWPSAMNYQNGPQLVQPRVYPLSLKVVVPAGATLTATARAQAAFKAQRFVVPSSIAPFFVINQIKIGARLQTVDGSDTGTPAEVYSEVAQNNLVDFDTIQPGIDVNVQVTNTSANQLTFFGTLIGPALIP
jgi:hypothetical protein